MSVVNGAYPSGSSSVDSTRAVALVDKLPWSRDVRLTAHGDNNSVCVYVHVCVSVYNMMCVCDGSVVTYNNVVL